MVNEVRGGVNITTNVEVNDLNTDLDYQNIILTQEDQVGDLPGTEDQSNYSVFDTVSGVSDIWQSFQQSIPGFFSTLEIPSSEGVDFTCDLTVYAGIGTGGTVVHTEVGATISAIEGKIALNLPPELPIDTPYTWRINNFSVGTIEVYKNTGVYTRGSSDLGGTDDYCFKTYSSLVSVIKQASNPDWEVISGDRVIFKTKSDVEYGVLQSDVGAETSLLVNASDGTEVNRGSFKIGTKAIGSSEKWSDLIIGRGGETSISMLDRYTIFEDHIAYKISPSEQVSSGGTFSFSSTNTNCLEILSNTVGAGVINTANPHFSSPLVEGETQILIGEDDVRWVEWPSTNNLHLENGKKFRMGKGDILVLKAYDGEWYEEYRSKNSAAGYDPSFVNAFTDNLSTPPTDAEFTAIHGTPASVGNSFMAIHHPANDPSNSYILISNGTTWHYTSMRINSYGEMYVRDNTTATTINTKDIWEEVDVITSSGELSGWTVSGSDLIAGSGSAGNYKVSAAISANSISAVAKSYQFAISINDVIQDNTICEKRLQQNIISSISISGIVEIAESDVIKLEVRNITDATNITVKHANVNVSSEYLDSPPSGGFPSAPAIYAQMCNIIDVVFSSVGVSQALILNIETGISGITHNTGLDSDEVTILTDGVYKFLMTANVKAGSGISGYFHMWMQIDTGSGFVDVAESNVKKTLVSLETDVVILSHSIDLNVGDKIRFRGSVGNTGIILDSESPSGEPRIPSTALSINYIGS